MHLQTITQHLITSLSCYPVIQKQGPATHLWRTWSCLSSWWGDRGGCSVRGSTPHSETQTSDHTGAESTADMQDSHIYISATTILYHRNFMAFLQYFRDWDSKRLHYISCKQTFSSHYFILPPIDFKLVCKKLFCSWGSISYQFMIVGDNNIFSSRTHESQEYFSHANRILVKSTKKKPSK